MAETEESTGSGKKKRFEMSPEHKQKMKEGRERAAAAKAAAEAAAERGEQPAPDLTTTSKPRSLPDIFQFYPIGDGKHFVQVVRTHPKRFYEQNVAGVQQPIKMPMTEEQFATFYGGAEYELRVYAQEERPDGTPYSKPLTDQIIYRVPGQPNIESAITGEEEMRYVPQPGRRMVGPERVGQGFEAPPVAVRRIQSQETMDERERAERRAERERAREEREEREERERSALTTVIDTKEKELERMEQSKDRELKLAREAEAAKQQASIARLEAQMEANGKQPQVDPLQVLKTAKDILGGDGASSAHLQQLIESHKGEVSRLHAEHERNISSERDRADKRIKEAEGGAERRIKEAEDRFDKRMKELEDSATRRIADVEQRADARVREAERQADQRLQDLDRQHNNRMADVKENHARELRAQEQAAGLGEKTVQVTLNARISTLESEQKRIEAENARLRRELEDAKRRAEDWLGQMQKFREQAEALGYVPPEEAGGGEGEQVPKTWQEMAAAVGMKMVANLPDVIDSVGKALQARRGGGVNPAAQQQLQRQRMIEGAQGTVPQTMAALPSRPMPQQQQLPFATEDGVGFIPSAQPPRPTHRMPPPHDTAPAPPQAPPMPQPTMPPPQPDQQIVVAGAPEHQQQPPAPALVTHQPNPAPAAPDHGGDGAELDPIIFGLASHYDAKTPPAEVVSILIAGVPPEFRESLKMLTFDQVIAGIGARKHEAAQKLMRREGQKYLRSVLTALQATLAKG